MMMIFCSGLNAPDFTEQSLSTVITNTVVVHTLMTDGPGAGEAGVLF